MENIKKNQTEILELKSKIIELKLSLERIKNMSEWTEERISELKDRSFEMIRSENKKKKEIET